MCAKMTKLQPTISWFLVLRLNILWTLKIMVSNTYIAAADNRKILCYYWILGETTEENANLVVRLLIRRPECLGPALRGEGGGLFAAIMDGIRMSEQIAAHKGTVMMMIVCAFLFSMQSVLSSRYSTCCQSSWLRLQDSSFSQVTELASIGSEFHFEKVSKLSHDYIHVNNEMS